MRIDLIVSENGIMFFLFEAEYLRLIMFIMCHVHVHVHVHVRMFMWCFCSVLFVIIFFYCGLMAND